MVSENPKSVADYFRTKFDAKVIETIQDGKPRIDVDLNGLSIFLFRAAPEDNLPGCAAGRYRGLDHFGLRVDDLDAACAELKRRGGQFTLEPNTIRPGLKIAFVRGPENIRIELLQRG
jgi:catechol 2,3-dioxygenase-like lactoylglutathione lyase family enzyme